LFKTRWPGNAGQKEQDRERFRPSQRHSARAEKNGQSAESNEKTNRPKSDLGVPHFFPRVLERKSRDGHGSRHEQE
jgi:hypothetical protein